MKGNLKSDKQYIPVNPEKYCGKYPIYIKSSWEEKFCQYLDYNNRVVEWSNESVRISYIDPTKGRRGVLDKEMGKSRIYYPDFYAKFNDGHRYIIEVKPQKDLRLPRKKGGKSQKTMYIREQTFLVNKAKFEAANRWCEKMGMKFVVITERQLFRNYK